MGRMPLVILMDSLHKNFLIMDLTRISEV